jgi:hypothetical protein
MAVDIKGAGQATQSYALFNPLDLYQDEVYAKLIGRVPHMNSLSWLKSMKNRTQKRNVNRSEYSYYQEQQWFNASAQIESVTPNGAKFDIVLKAGSHQSIGGTNNKSFVVKNMFVLFADGQTSGFVESHDKAADGAHEITVKKVNASQDIGAVALAGTTMVFFSNGQPEQGGKTESRVEQYDKVTNKVQIVREYFEVTDKEAQNASWFETSSGKKYLWYHGISTTAERFEMQRELSALLLPQGASLTDLAGAPVETMNGLFPQIRQHGSTVEYLSKPDGAGFDEIMLQLNDAYSDKKFFVGHGMNYMLALKDFLVEFAKNGTGNISFSPFEGGEKQAISLNFKSYSVGAWEFYFNEWDILSHRDSLGADGLPFRHMAAYLPAGMTKNPDPNRPAGASEYEPYICLVSPNWGMPLPNIDKGDYLMWETGALAANGPTSDILEKGVHFVAYDSFEMRCRNKFLLHEIANVP